MKRLFILAGISAVILFFGLYLYPRFFSSAPPVEYKELVITLQRSVCFGTCPAYQITLTGDGKVSYEGERFVKVVGKETGQIPKDKVKEIIKEFYKINYFSLQDRYDAPVTDLPTTTTSIMIDGKTKKVVNYYGAPKELFKLEDKIDEVTDSKKWVKGN